MSVFYVHATPFVVVNDAAAVRTVLSGSGGVFIKPRYFGYRSAAVRAAVDADNALCSATADDGSPVGGGGAATRRVLLNLLDANLPLVCEAVEALLASFPVQAPATTTGGPGTAVVWADGAAAGVDSQPRVTAAVVALNLRLLFDVGTGFPGADNPTAADAAARIGVAGAEFARRLVNPARAVTAPLAGLRYAAAVVGLVRLGRRLVTAVDSLPPAHWVGAWVGAAAPVAKLGKVVGLLMASSQTVPTSVLWLLHLLATHPAVRARIAAEAASVLGGVALADEAPSADAAAAAVAAAAAAGGPRWWRPDGVTTLERLPYTEAVVKEALRLFPPFPLIARVATADTSVGGVAIPARTPVYVLPWLLHRNGAHFRNPHTFDPDRWLPAAGGGARVTGGAPSEWVFAPFGRGPRACAGAAVALTELKVAALAAAVDWRYGVGWAEGGAPDVYPALGVVPAGIQVVRTH